MDLSNSRVERVRLLQQKTILRLRVRASPRAIFFLHSLSVCVGDCLQMVRFRASIVTIDVEVQWLLSTTGQVQIFAGGECAEHLDD